MRITSLEEYGLRCALQLARSKQRGQLIAASQVAELEGLSVEYVSKIMHLFRKGGLVLSTRGIQGGFSLAKEPAEISVRQVLDVLAVTQKGADDLVSFCTQHAGTQAECVHKGACSIRPVWSHIFDVFDRVLASITLADLLVGAPAWSEKIRALGMETSGVEEQKNESL